MYRASGVRWCKVMGVVCSATIRLSVRNEVARAAWADHPKGGSAVVGEVSLELVPQILMVVYSRFLEES
ncbi:hypothetical protein TIFTF001_036695 [Ficus carica]|uniref:Uncharacterized protein n=1 Tax=Ficus carica TaxID=3494 RepID=A0AA88J816_FICCA|nr:hypothetical protein TIFTF001_036695 [Ficus carica]